MTFFYLALKSESTTPLQKGFYLSVSLFAGSESLTEIPVLVIRLQRTGRRNQVSYRVVVAEKSSPVKGRHVAILGFYNPSENKKISIDTGAAQEWMSKGARPSQTVAYLLKTQGVKNMEAFMKAQNLKREVKNPN